ncbi:histone-lysine N-methyltransferase eggless-like isoform X1 [Lytechinus variegatus]|uniref:histone-lysine N-methyltransferase eggless-like isoform X1 n=1 Tax=Lytechinus variegatus TaxID=7654 RepID=UPI001BB23F9C|nr:histone-lysine N-methyltransferase eggless-like isoform X1 [Lytechinus variegatus]
MAEIAEAFMLKVTAGLDEQLAELDKKITRFNADVTPQNEKLLNDIGTVHHRCEELHDEIQGLLNKQGEREKAAKERQDEYDKNHLFKSPISPSSNPKTIHELYEEMDLLDIDSDEDNDHDSGNEMGDGDNDDVHSEDEIIFIGKTDLPPTSQKRSANEARLTPPNPLSRPVGPMDKETVGKTATPPRTSPQKATPVSKLNTITPQSSSSLPSTQESPKAASVSPVTLASRTSSTTAPVMTQTVTVESAGSTPGRTTVAKVQQDGNTSTIVIPASMLPRPKNLPNAQQSNAPLRFLMLTTAKNAAGQEVKSVKTLLLQNPQGVPLNGQVVLKIQDGQQNQLMQPSSQVLQVLPHGKAQGTPSAPAGKRPPGPAEPSKTSSEVVEIVDDDDDIVMVSSTPATSAAKKSTPVKAMARAPSAIPGQDGSPGKVRQGVQLIHGADYDAHLMEGEEMMFGDDEATLPGLVEGKKVLAKGEESFWYQGILIGPPIHHKGMKKYKVKFEHGRKRLLSSKFLAVITSSKPADLAVGIRVVASYLVEEGAKTKGMYAGIIAEVPMKTNRGRYLVFFDDGYAQYLSCDKIHIVYHSSACVWADVDIFSRNFIREYLDKYPDRAMVNLKKDQLVMTEWNGKWWNARVLEVQGSLANMLFAATPSRRAETEWIYRGSTRLKPLLDLGDKKNAGINTVPTPEQLKHNLPYVEMTKVHSDHILPERQIPQPKPAMLGSLNNQQSPSMTSSSYHFSQLLQQCAQQTANAPSFAKKSSSSASSVSTSYESSRNEHKKKKKKKNKHRERRKDRYEEDKLFEPETRVDRFVRKERLRYVPHVCSPLCLGSTPQVVDRTRNPLLVPLDLGWVRELCKQGGSSYKRHVVYRAPCGKSLCSFDDVSRYLRETKSEVLSIDRFTFASHVHISFKQRNTRQNSRFYYMELPDLSNGVEKVPVSCVNEYDTDEPPPLKYMTERQAVLRGSKVNTDPNFLVCCECTDDCSDASKCACRQLTISSSAWTRDGKPKPDVGYKNRLLKDQVQTGIFECNDNCKCSNRCENKVVQNGLSLRLQVFKTYDRGWGIRCLDDIPKGMFVCTYAGQIWNEEEANRKGKEHGDEYFAELDFIENVEAKKEGYESDVEDPIDNDLSDKDSDDSNQKTQSSSDEDFNTAQSELSSDDSADIINPSSKANTKDSTNQKESSGGTRLVLRRQSESTDQSQWSVSLASPNAKKDATPPRSTPGVGSSVSTPESQKAALLKYGYDPSLCKEVLDQKQVEAFRQRRQARNRQASGVNSEEDSKRETTPSSGSNNDDDIKIVGVQGLSSTKEEEDDKKVAMETDLRREGSVSKSLSELGLEETKDEDDKDKKPPKPKVTGPRARKSTNSRMRQRYMGSPGNSLETTQTQKKEEEEKDERKSSHPSLRSLYGETHCYVMDAKYMGNLGRYLNHSCRPNLFVQNVFVDSHDLRFPWVAFFAAQFIRAGSELNWDYMYEVGCVPGKEIKCLCKNPDCRGRLL